MWPWKKLKKGLNIRVFSKVWKRAHQNLQIFFFNLQKTNYISIQGGWNSKNAPIFFCGKLSFILFPERLPLLLPVLHIFSLLLLVQLLIYLEPCALNVEFQHFILRFNKNFLTLRTSLKVEIVGERRPKDRVTLRKTLLLKKLSSNLKWCYSIISCNMEGLSLHPQVEATEWCRVHLVLD